MSKNTTKRAILKKDFLPFLWFCFACVFLCVIPFISGFLAGYNESASFALKTKDFLTKSDTLTIGVRDHYNDDLFDSFCETFNKDFETYASHYFKTTIETNNAEKTVYVFETKPTEQQYYNSYYIGIWGSSGNAWSGLADGKIYLPLSLKDCVKPADNSVSIKGFDKCIVGGAYESDPKYNRTIAYLNQEFGDIIFAPEGFISQITEKQAIITIFNKAKRIDSVCEKITNMFTLEKIDTFDFSYSSLLTNAIKNILKYKNSKARVVVGVLGLTISAFAYVFVYLSLFIDKRAFTPLRRLKQINKFVLVVPSVVIPLLITLISSKILIDELIPMNNTLAVFMCLITSALLVVFCLLPLRKKEEL